MTNLKSREKYKRMCEAHSFKCIYEVNTTIGDSNMAKYTRYRKYSRRYRSGRWSPNIKSFPSGSITVEGSSTFFATTVLCTNPAQNDTTVSQRYTVKNIETSFVIESGTTNTTIENLTAYIMYVPQGMTIDVSYDVDHPEYILNYKFIGSPSPDGGQQYQPSRVKSRLARKLNTGDSIILYIKGYNLGTASSTLEYHGLVRWWTKAN